ncbi:MAG: DUF3127 domain-containing protein [Flavobacteriales bacterium]|nr:DUF3127 domain-containing protein [Flavobacteriales bacterium]
MEISGKVKKIFDTQTRGTFTFREMVITTQEQYPQDIIIQFTQDKIELLDLYKIGDELKVSINIRGREWINPEGEAKYFTTIQGWRIERLNQQVPTSSDIPSETPVPQSANDLSADENEEDDLPF